MKTLAGLVGVLLLSACAPSAAEDPVVEVEVETKTEIAEIPQIAETETKDDFGALLDEYLALNQRLENVAWRILSANAKACPEVSPEIGMKVHIVEDYPEDLQVWARALLNLDNRLAVRIIAEGSPAQSAGFKPGDKIIKIGPFELPESRTGAQLFHAVSDREFLLGQTTLKIEQNGEPRDITVNPIKTCSYPAQLFYAEDVNAHTDGEEIWVTSELVRQLKDDRALALVVAHELAHAVLGHLLMEPAKELELEADRLSLIYLAEAGYDPEEAVEIWKASPFNHEKNASGFHPSTEERLRVLNAALAELQNP